MPRDPTRVLRRLIHGALGLPDRFVERSLTLTAKFERYDPATGIVSYVGPAGPRTHRVVDPEIANDLRRLRRGDMVDLIFAEAIHVQKI